MNNIQKIAFNLHLLLTVLFMGCYIVWLVIDKDELEEKAQSYALKYSNLLTVIFLISYALYKSVIGNIEFTPHIILIVINILSVLYLLFYFLYIKGIIISFKVKNTKILDGIGYLVTVVTVISIITQFLKVKIFEISSSFLRLDTLVLIINFIFISLIMGMCPKKKLSREEYKERQASASKFTKIFAIVYGVLMLCLIGYGVYKVYTK